MVEDRMRAWETLFRRASSLIDSAGQSFERWSFGGGTVLMRRHLHRFSKDIDIFVPDPQYLGYVSPRLNDVAAKMTSDYIEHPGAHDYRGDLWPVGRSRDFHG